MPPPPVKFAQLDPSRLSDMKLAGSESDPTIEPAIVPRVSRPTPASQLPADSDNISGLFRAAMTSDGGGGQSPVKIQVMAESMSAVPREGVNLQYQPGRINRRSYEGKYDDLNLPGSDTSFQDEIRDLLYGSGTVTVLPGDSISNVAASRKE